jgi:glycosyltransferase involved in cell wall biosynthesis
VTAGLTEAEPAASVIVPVRGHPEWLALCIEGLRRQDFGEDFEVLVAANCPEGDVECIRRDFPYVRVVPCDPGGGPGGQRNRAIEEARGTYIVLTDDDCVAGRSWLRTMVDACRARNGAVVWGWVSTAYPWDRNSRALNLSENGQFRPRHGVVTQGVGGGNMCVERALVCESGARFAEGVYGAEEIQFLLALPDRARPVVHEPRAVVRHLRHDDFMGSLARQYRLGRGSARVRLQQRMRGSSAAEWPFLAPLLAPLRFVLTIWRVLRTAPGELGTLLGLSPLVALHHAAYAAGFAVGALTARPNRGQIPTAAAGGTGGRR